MNSDEIAILALWRAGLSGTQAGEQLGKTRNAVIGAIFRLRKRGVDVTRIEGNVTPLPKKPRPPRMKKVAAPVAPAERDRSIMALTALTCRYPFGDTRSPGGVTYCCERVEKPGSSVYCAEHALRCRQPLRVA